jgi:hypothetical protein
VTVLAELSGADLRQLASAADLRDQRRANCLATLYQGPTIGAFAPGASPLPPLLPEQLESALCALALHGWSGKGLARAAEGYTAGRLPPEIVCRVVNDTIRRRRAGAL